MNPMRIFSGFRMKNLFCASVAVLFLSGPALAHGPGGHGGSSFTALQALDKGVKLYDKLVASGKIEESWETGLKRVEIEKQGDETVVSFSRKEGDPESLYIFFDKDGEYSGSNFTGK
ncbi:MAG: DUF6488 family protein [Desulfobacterales bacterium]|nr:DUF6488 family protein [Desulfobacterales bacterium]